jgi:hypothetical protein
MSALGQKLSQTNVRFAPEADIGQLHGQVIFVEGRRDPNGRASG